MPEDEADLIQIDSIDAPEEDVTSFFTDLEVEPKAFTLNERSPNILRDLEDSEDSWLRSFVASIVDRYEAARLDSEGYRERFRKDWNLFESLLPEKSFPWSGCSNANVPILFENILRMALRIEGELFGDWKQVFSYIPLSGTEESRAEADAMTKHDNWQLLNDSPGFVRSMRKGILLFLFGDVTFHVYRDEKTRTNRVEVLTPDEFTVPFTNNSVCDDWGDVPWRARTLKVYRNQLDGYRGVWDPNAIDKLLESDPIHAADLEEDDLATSQAELRGIDPDLDDPLDRPFHILVWEGWADVPGQEKQRYMRFVVEHGTRTPLQVSVWEEYDWRDRQRYEMQVRQKKEFIAAIGAFRQMAMQQSMAPAGHVMGPQGEMGPQPLPEPPEPPQWLLESGMDAQPEPMRLAPISEYVHAVAIEPLSGNRGVGFARPLGDFNRAAKTNLDLHIDASVLANAQCFLMSQTAQFDKDSTGVEPGKFLSVSHEGEDISKAFLPLQFPPPNPDLRETISMFWGWGQSSVQAPDVISGAEGKSGETKGGLSMRLEQATAQLRVVTINFARAVSQVVDKNRWLNSMHLDDEQTMSFFDQTADAMTDVSVRRQNYQKSYKHSLASDIRFATKTQRVAEADELLSFQGMPFLQNAGPAAAPFFLEAFKMGLKARGLEKMEPFLEPIRQLFQMQMMQMFQPPPQQGEAPPEEGAPEGQQPPAQPGPQQGPPQQ